MDAGQPQKILVISHEYPPIGGGGGKVIQGLCEGLASKDTLFYILTAHFDDLPGLETNGFLTIERLHTSRKEAYRASLWSMVCFVWKSFWRALRIIRFWEPDLIHAHFAVPGGAAAALSALATSKPHILTIHGGDVPGGAPEKTGNWFRFIKPFTGFIWKRAKRIIAVSEYSRQLALTHYPVNIDIIPNGIDRAPFSNSNSSVHQPPHILFVGRFSPEKNAVAVLEILKQITDQVWTCTMIGDGTQFPLVQKMVEENSRLQNRISLAGWVSQDQVEQTLQQSDILLMPSLRESMPMVGLQALAAGNALILSNVGACPEMVDEGKNGFLVEPVDLKCFANRLQTLLSDRKKLGAFKKHSKKKSVQFDIKEILERYQHVYTELARE